VGGGVPLHPSMYPQMYQYIHSSIEQAIYIMTFAILAARKSSISARQYIHIVPSTSAPPEFGPYRLGRSVYGPLRALPFYCSGVSVSV